MQVLWVVLLTFVLTLPITDCFTSQFGCFTHYFDYLWTLWSFCGNHFLSVFKSILWSSFTLWSFYKYLWLLWTSIHFFCFYFGYFEVTTHPILPIMVIMLFCPTLRQLGASFCGCSLHLNFFLLGGHIICLCGHLTFFCVFFFNLCESAVII